MKHFLWLLLLLIAAPFLTWRFASQWLSLPCPSWLSWLIERENPLAPHNRASALVEQLTLQPDMSVLDAGCGPGRLTIPLAEAVGPHGGVTALDMQHEMLERVRKKAESAGLNNITYIQNGLGTGALAFKHYYDRIVLSAVMGEIPTDLQGAALNEIHTALKGDGLLLIAEIIFDPHFQSKQAVLTLAAQHGFKLVEVRENFAGYALLLGKTRPEKIAKEL